MADTVWFEVSCSQIPFVTLGQFGFQIMCLDQSVTFQEHQIRKTLGPQEQVRWYSMFHSRAGARTTKVVKFLGFVQEWTWCERHVFMMPSHHDTVLLAIRIVPASPARCSFSAGSSSGEWEVLFRWLTATWSTCGERVLLQYFGASAPHKHHRKKHDFWRKREERIRYEYNPNPSSGIHFTPPSQRNGADFGPKPRGVHISLSCVAVDPCIPTMLGRSTSEFTRTGRQCYRPSAKRREVFGEWNEG